ncbi:F-box only protein 9 isoform X2 [Nomia melanderi]|uniref:F-box only protein 9 isoform X2 n=1 Tax=Nomia melanderi TaxID=2448451 RepID=UPI001303F617|nr:F-box only protein 9 [Nomia melanderi]XP_031829529.1 F-box only protein 9 [Nomia melanderi]
MSQTSQSGKSDDDGEDQEGSSFSETKIEDALTSFREQWQRELVLSPRPDTSKALPSKAVEINVDYEDETIEEKAKSLFLTGIEYEQNRKFYEAIQFYKRAVQLVPDIEFRLYESTKMKPIDDNLENLDNDSNSVDNNDENHNEEDEEESDLFFKLCKIVNRNKCVCFPKFEQNTTHISALPMEIMLYILRWVVSSELDMRSLEMFSRVCRGFYISARDTEIWRLACVRAWGVNCGTYIPKYQSWREMYLQRPRLRYNGCYISKTSYIRHGENSFQDQFYRPWHLVEYFRYLRFFPEGKVLMLTSTDDAQTCVNSLRSRAPRNPAVLIGHYRLHVNYVTVVLKKQEAKASTTYRKKKKEPLDEHTFHIEFEIKEHFKRTNSLLKWLSYTIFTKYGNGQEVRTCLKEPSMKEWRVSSIGGRYPPLKFSRVKSYTQESEAPLQ